MVYFYAAFFASTTTVVLLAYAYNVSVLHTQRQIFIFLRFLRVVLLVIFAFYAEVVLINQNPAIFINPENQTDT